MLQGLSKRCVHIATLLNDSNDVCDVCDEFHSAKDIDFVGRETSQDYIIDKSKRSFGGDI